MKDIMLDLETVGSSAGCGILSIGAVAFDYHEQKLGDTFDVVVRRNSCLMAGLREDEDTLKWWKKQSPAARHVLELAEDPDNSLELREALNEFNEYLSDFGSPRDVCVWANGADFDLPIIIHAYKAVGLEPGWKFFNHRCFRTLKNNPYYNTTPPPRNGVAHNALDDAVAQAEHAMAIFEVMKRGRAA